MANEIIRPSALETERTSPVASEFLVTDNETSVAKVTIEKAVQAGRPAASKNEAEAGSDANKVMTPLTVQQKLDYEIGRSLASKAQGDKADTAVQPSDLGAVATSNDYDDLDNKPTLGTAAAEDVGAFATAEQGGKADTAIQSVVEGSGIGVDLTDPQNPVISYTGTDGVSDGDKGDVIVSDTGAKWELARDRKTVADLLADTVFSYSAGSGKTLVEPGQIITAQGFRYEVAASGATDAHIETAGGVKVYVLTQHKRLYAAAFGLEADTGADVTLLSQKVIDALPSGEGITLVFAGGRYKVSKNTSLANYPGNDQPCLEFRGKTNFRVEADGAVFFCETHAQGVFEFQLCEDGEIVGLKAEGAGDFPSLDGSTGRGEKGTNTAGYHTSGFQGYYKNNSYDTSANTGGGFGGAFPQYGGGTAASWGTWNGGFIGNQGHGFLVHNGCKSLTFSRCGATQFNGSGFKVGFLGDYYPTDRGYSDCENIKSVNCDWDENYDSGTDFSAVDGWEVAGGSLSNNGHPNADPVAHTTADPGYGFTGRGNPYSPARNGDIHHVKKVFGNKRKGIDIHAGLGNSILSNYIEDAGLYGIDVEWGSASQPTKESIIAFNHLKNCSYGSASGGASIFVYGIAGADISVNTIVSQNIVEDTGGAGIYVRYGDYAQVKDNIVRGRSSTGSMEAMILVVGSGVSDKVRGVLCTGNIVEDSNLAVAGISMSFTEDCEFSSNLVRLTGSSVANGIFGGNNDSSNTSVHDNNVILGAAGAPYNLYYVGGPCYANRWSGGSAAPVIKPNSKAALSVADELSFTVTFNGTATPAVSDVVGSNISVTAASTSNGVSFAFGGAVPSNTALRTEVSTEILSSNGLVAGGSNPSLVYVRTTGATGVELGIKATWTSSHTAASSLTGGSLRVTVSFR